MPTTIAAINPRLIAAVSSDPAALLAAAAAELAVRAGDEMLSGGDVTAAMEHARAALAVLSGLFRKGTDENGPLYEAQYTGSRGDADAMSKCNDAGWAMHEAASALADALTARAR